MYATRPILSYIDQVENTRRKVSLTLDKKNKISLGQYFTPFSIGSFMAQMFTQDARIVTILDAGAGIGSLTAALVMNLCYKQSPPKLIRAVLYEIDSSLHFELNKTMQLCQSLCQTYGIEFRYNLKGEDFIVESSLLINTNESEIKKYNYIIMNPPYQKLSTKSWHRRVLSMIGIESSNLYSAFLSLAFRLLAYGGEIVAIIPRSFCNGPYFRSFRMDLLKNVSLERFHIFNSREKAFHDDGVLQENIILHAQQGFQQNKITISSSEAPGSSVYSHVVSFDDIVHDSDTDCFIHLAISQKDLRVLNFFKGLANTLKDLNINVSTGKLVDFRSKEYLSKDPQENTVPLIYPYHFRDGSICWPVKNNRKPNALINCEATKTFLVPNGNYVLVRRFSSKEENRRINAVLFKGKDVPFDKIAFENHLNYYHSFGVGLEENLAYGLTAYLNSSLVDKYFRIFNGHTQVNATDLRKLKYPTVEELNSIGEIAKQPDKEKDLNNEICSILGFNTSNCT